jgi:hypothetical protein
LFDFAFIALNALVLPKTFCLFPAHVATCFSVGGGGKMENCRKIQRVLRRRRRQNGYVLTKIVAKYNVCLLPKSFVTT